MTAVLKRGSGARENFFSGIRRTANSITTSESAALINNAESLSRADLNDFECISPRQRRMVQFTASLSGLTNRMRVRG